MATRICKFQNVISSYILQIWCSFWYLVGKIYFCIFLSSRHFSLKWVLSELLTKFDFWGPFEARSSLTPGMCNLRHFISWIGIRVRYNQVLKTFATNSINKPYLAPTLPPLTPKREMSIPNLRGTSFYTQKGILNDMPSINSKVPSSIYAINL